MESTHVAAVGYRDGRVFVQFKYGAVYCQPAQEGIYWALLEAPSKGNFIRENLKALVKAEALPEGSGLIIPAVVPAPPVNLKLTPAETPLTEMQGDDAGCCRVPFIKAAQAGITGDVWACPVCGTEWHARTIPEAHVREWRPDCPIVVFHGR